MNRKTCSTDLQATPSSPIGGDDTMSASIPNEDDATSVGENERKVFSENVLKLLSQLEGYCRQEAEDGISSPPGMDDDWMGSSSNNVGFPALVMTGFQAVITSWLENGSGNTSGELSKDIDFFIKRLEDGEYQEIRYAFFKQFLESLRASSMGLELGIGNQDGEIHPDLSLQLEEYWLQHDEGIMLSALAKYTSKMKEIKEVAIVHDDDDMPEAGKLSSDLQGHWSQHEKGIMLSALAKYSAKMMEIEGATVVHDDDDMPEAGDLSSQLYESWAQKDNSTSMIEALENFNAKTNNGQVGPSIMSDDTGSRVPVIAYHDDDGDVHDDDGDVKGRRRGNTIKFKLADLEEEAESSSLHENGKHRTQPDSSDKPAMLDFQAAMFPQTPMPTIKNALADLPLSRRNSLWGGGKEKTSPATVFHVTWWITYVVNVIVYIIFVFITPQGRPGDYGWPGLAAGIPVCVLLLTTSILITDITTDFLCIGFAMLNPSLEGKMIGHVSNCPVTPKRQTQYLVVYCLKSSEREDIESTLKALKCSWRLNQTYGGNATYLILSGTQAPDLVDCEMDGIQEWNAEHAEEGGHVRYIRRCRSVLFKYGQYLDLLMLINGHKEPVLFSDQKSKHPSGEVFDPFDTKDVGHLYGSDYEYIVLCDRDNVLSYDFFHIATNFFAEHPDIEILQPAITPFPEEFRKGEEGDSAYSMVSTLFQKLGLALQRYKRIFIPSAAFYGKGIIRRSVYNKTLLGYNPTTGTTSEEHRIPRDLLSHDIIESSIMRTMMAPELAIYEEFPLTHLEWSIRAARWDLGDLIVSKYLYPFSFGLLPNLLSKFTFHSVTPFYEDFFRNNSAAVYSSTYNLRCVLVKPLVLLTMLAYILANLSTFGILLLSLFVNLEVLLLPLVGMMKISLLYSLSMCTGME